MTLLLGGINMADSGPKLTMQYTVNKPDPITEYANNTASIRQYVIDYKTMCVNYIKHYNTLVIHGNPVHLCFDCAWHIPLVAHFFVGIILMAWNNGRHTWINRSESYISASIGRWSSSNKYYIRYPRSVVSTNTHGAPGVDMTYWDTPELYQVYIKNNYSMNAVLNHLSKNNRPKEFHLINETMKNNTLFRSLNTSNTATAALKGKNLTIKHPTWIGFHNYQGNTCPHYGGNRGFNDYTQVYVDCRPSSYQGFTYGAII